MTYRQTLRKLCVLGVLAVVTLAGTQRPFTLRAAQLPAASQHGSVTQQIGGTRITIEYNRPVARGRDLFGELVPWGQVWCPGADEATTIEVSTELKVNGENLPAGKYSLWAQPQPDQWTIIFSRTQPTWHTPYPRGRDALRVEATPRKGEHMETLAFYFPVADGRHGELVLHWGTTVVPLELDVP